MAWNEPGGSGNKDPWGNRNSDQGPPDLDEVFKKVQDKLSGLFGGRGGGRSGGGGGGGTLGAGIIAAVLLVIWALSGIYIVDEGKEAVVLRFGAFEHIEGPGPHWYPRFIERVEIVDVSQVRSVNIGQASEEARMLTQDENIVNLTLAVQYKVNDPKEYLFSVNDPEGTLREATESAVREVVGRKSMDDIITVGRSEVATSVRDLAQQILDHYKTGLRVTKVNIKEAQPPAEVKPAFVDAINAREDREKVINEAKAYANDVLPRARGKAARMEQEASGYRDSVVARAQGESDRFRQLLSAYEKAPKVTRERMYLETMQSVLAKSSKVLVDVPHGSNLMYLPLDKLMERAAHQPGGSSKQSSSSSSSSSSSGSGSGSSSSSSDSQSQTGGFLRDRLRNREMRR
ncbi:MAG TPA: FtsH protease activity modulator HflK [Gammaproteobacteria bacterium]|nr:FtsH protease activity modulator HflK [Gammaproteobacteria bacterium]